MRGNSQKVFDFLAQQGPTGSKHRRWLHPICTMLVHYAVVISVMIQSHDWLRSRYFYYEHKDPSSLEMSADVFLSDTDPSQQQLLQRRHVPTTSSSHRARQNTVAAILALYVTWLFLSRILLAKPAIYRNCVFYELCWLCNGTLIVSALALCSAINKPAIAIAFLLTVGIDQLLWYVDFSVALATRGRFFCVGVSKYIFWPTTSWVTKLSCTHHLWTIPLVLYGCSRMDDDNRSRGIFHHNTSNYEPTVPWISLPLSFVCMTTNVLLSRYMIPIACKPADRQDRRTINSNNSHPAHLHLTGGNGASAPPPRYLNINLSHEIWKDIPILQFANKNPAAHVYLAKLFLGWQLLSVAVFFVLRGICTMLGW